MKRADDQWNARLQPALERLRNLPEQWDVHPSNEQEQERLRAVGRIREELRDARARTIRARAAPTTKPPVKRRTRQPVVVRPLVLLADDDYDNREMYAGYLTANGFRVTAARDGAQALRFAKQLRPAIIVLDVQMPRVDGIAATRQIRLDETLRDTPILVVTAYDGEEQDALNAGANAVCVKPCLPSDLIIRIQQLLPEAATPVRASTH